MALADYDTAEEKIAALKCALMDPALVNLCTASFVTSEPIYLITNSIAMNGCGHEARNDSISSLACKIGSGNTVAPHCTTVGANPGFLYANDSDINYSDPITTYKNRLSLMINCDLQFASSFTVGSNNALLIATSQAGTIYINGYWCIGNKYDPSSYSLMTPVKSGYSIGSAKGCFYYIDLPSNW